MSYASTSKFRFVHNSLILSRNCKHWPQKPSNPATTTSSYLFSSGIPKKYWRRSKLKASTLSFHLTSKILLKLCSSCGVVCYAIIRNFTICLKNCYFCILRNTLRSKYAWNIQNSKRKILCFEGPTLSMTLCKSIANCCLYSRQRLLNKSMPHWVTSIIELSTTLTSKTSAEKKYWACSPVWMESLHLGNSLASWREH